MEFQKLIDYVNGKLDDREMLDVAAYLSENPDAQNRVKGLMLYKRQNPDVDFDKYLKDLRDRLTPLLEDDFLVRPFHTTINRVEPVINGQQYNLRKARLRSDRGFPVYRSRLYSLNIRLRKYTKLAAACMVGFLMGSASIVSIMNSGNPDAVNQTSIQKENSNNPNLPEKPDHNGKQSVPEKDDQQLRANPQNNTPRRPHLADSKTSNQQFIKTYKKKLDNDIIAEKMP